MASRNSDAPPAGGRQSSKRRTVSGGNMRAGGGRGSPGMPPRAKSVVDRGGGVRSPSNRNSMARTKSVRESVNRDSSTRNSMVRDSSTRNSMVRDSSKRSSMNHAKSTREGLGATGRGTSYRADGRNERVRSTRSEGMSARGAGKRSSSIRVKPSDALAAEENESRGSRRSGLKYAAASMGQSLSLIKVNGAEVSNNVKKACDLLNLSSKDIGALKLKFDQGDTDGSGEIEISEFFKMVGEEETSFTTALFEHIDTDNSGTINFNEFVSVLTSYCIYSQDDVLRFIFTFFDKDGSGTLDENEFIDMCVQINANAHFPGNLTKAFRGFDCNDDGLIDFDEFREINRRYPMLLFPAFRLQDAMQRCTLGSRRWTKALKFKASQERIQAYKDSHGGAMPPSSGGCLSFLRRS